MTRIVKWKNRYMVSESLQTVANGWRQVLMKNEIYRPSGRSRFYDLFRKSGVPLRKLPERYLAHHYETI